MLAAERDGVIGMIRDAIVRYKLTRKGTHRPESAALKAELPKRLLALIAD